MDTRIFLISVYFDSTNTVESLIDKAIELGHTGVAITDHESVSGHVRAIKYIKKLKEKGVIDDSFAGCWGNEIYLVDSREDVRDNYQGGGVTKFPHFLILAKNRQGHEAMRRMSSHSWENSFVTGGMRRVPTTKAELQEIVRLYPDSLIFSSACLGSETSIHILNDDYDKAEEFIEWCIDVIGKEDFYLEIQPNVSPEQTKVNNKLIEYSAKYGLELILTFDAHFLDLSDKQAHAAYLNAKQGDRETEAFYADTFMHTMEQVYEKLHYIDKDILDRAIANTDVVGKKIEQYDLHNDTRIPRIELPEFKVKHIFARVYDKFPNIKRAAYSDEIQDRYLLYQIEKGFLEKESNGISQEYFYKVLTRIEEELFELLELSSHMNQTMSSYYITMQKIIDIIWDSSEFGGDSLVGGRGSVGAFYLAYLLGITEFNPLTAGVTLPAWRHIDHEKWEVSDIDLDTCATRRTRIIRALKHYFGNDKVLSVSTFGTETSRSTIKTSMRSLGYNSDDAAYLGSLLESSRGATRTLSDSLSGDDGEPINTKLRNEMEKYPQLIETALALESLINKSSQHAGGVCIYNEPYWKTNALMLTPKGIPVTQYNLKDSEYVGDIKYDILTTEAMDKLRETLDSLLEHNEIEWQGNLKDTFNAYFHPKVLDTESPELYEMMASGEVPDLFQFTSELGKSILSKVKPSTPVEASAASNLMRLQAPPGEEQPVDTFARYRQDISLWYDEMREHGLEEDEMKILEEHLLPLNGVCDSQESLMLMVMDERISDFDKKWANKLRKAVAKKDPKSLEETRNHYLKHSAEIGISDNFRDYVWDVQIQRHLGYSFPASHSLQYITVMLQELNMSYRFSPVYWQTACLNINSGSVEIDKESGSSGSIDYGKVSTAVGRLKSIGVNIKPPSINRSKYSFAPDAENNSIIYGLKPIKTMNERIVDEIIGNRPYNSLKDVLTKLYDTKIITNTHLIALTKSGALDEFGERKHIMMEIIKYITPTKEFYTLASVNKLIESGVLKDRPEYPLILLRESFKKSVLRKEKAPGAKTPHKIFKVNKMEEYSNLLGEIAVIGVSNNYYEIDEKEFKKEFDKQTKDLKEWLKSPEAVDKINRYELNQQWIKYALGTYSAWEMETLNYYHHEHELIGVDDERYGVVRFNSLQKEAPIEKYFTKNGRDIPLPKTAQIAGTVLGVDKLRSSITLLDVDGEVLSVKYAPGTFAHYNKTISKTDSKGKKTTIESPWFKRGNKLLITGYRRGNQFVAKTYKHSVSQHTTKLITYVEPDGTLYYDLERKSN